MSARDAATRRQVEAARPDVSTWLAANAGSGKTRVLTDRVARLLLDGVQPQHVLCLTYTKAAASEMQNRLFQQLGKWAMLDDAALRAELAELGAGGTADPVALARARTLFARAIETPGGLKIQTIHAFCAGLLRRFPLEAGVSPQFAEMEDRAAALLRSEIVDALAEGPDAAVIDGIAAHVAETRIETLTAEIAKHRDAFAALPDRRGLLALFGLPDGFDERKLLAEVFTGGEVELIRSILPVLVASGGHNARDARKLDGFREASIEGLEILETALLTGPGAKQPFAARIGSFPTKPLQTGELAPQMPALDALMARVEAGRERRLALAALARTEALHAFAAAFLPEYAWRKQLRGWLDFDDLILKARDLLGDPEVAAWVLYRLDGGIDHILIDEAQDTSPAQWDVVEKLAQEFTSGIGARSGVERTIFVVGDKKQSIYSFQGADPEAFDRMQREFGRRLEDSGAQLADLTLEFSFRSAQVILGLVDALFDGRAEAGFAAGIRHRAFKADLPGRVDLWPVVEKVEAPDDRPWTDPLDRKSDEHHNVILARRIADEILRMKAEETIPDEAEGGRLVQRPVREGDILILVQRRSDLFSEIIRACKAADLKIAGADRLKVGAELAVKDLAALLAFLATPEDSLSLATVLKSPLCGWSEQELFDLAHRRDEPFLWQALRRRGAEFPQTLAMLRDLRGQTDFLRPYDLIERILTRHDGRSKLLARLGPEAEDGINALLGQALAYERTDIPSLTGFLVWMETDDLEIKRQVGTGGDMIRVMTVHGAKGLEAPIVILPDTAARRAPADPELADLAGIPVWQTRVAEMPAALAEARSADQARRMQERLRLLYVALTRAEKWLIVAAAGDLGRCGESWYQMVETAMTGIGAEPVEMFGGTGLRVRSGDWDGLPRVQPPGRVEHSVALPRFFRNPAAAPPTPRVTLSPSDLGGAKALPGEDGSEEEAAKRRGEAVHLLLERLPLLDAADWPRAARRLLPLVGDEEGAGMLQEARAVLTAPHLAEVFAAETLSEVPITAEIMGARIHGVIDRLIVSPARVLAVDFKTNATVPETAEACPEGLLRQMGAYALALAQVYPCRHIETAILWTRTAQLMPLPHDLVVAALERSPHLDATGGRS